MKERYFLKIIDLKKNVVGLWKIYKKEEVLIKTWIGKVDIEEYKELIQPEQCNQSQMSL